MLPPSNALLRLCAATALAATLTGPLRAQRYDPELLASSLLADTGFADARPETFDLEAFLDRAFLSLPLGLYDVRIPTSALDTQTAARNSKEACQAFADVQCAFLGWLEPGGRIEPQVIADAELLAHWIGDWRFGDLADIAADPARPRALLDALDASEEVRAAAQRLTKVMRSGAVVGLQRKDAPCEPLILAPTRKDFLTLCAFGGWLWPGSRDTFWNPGVTTWTHCTIDRHAVLALEYADVGTQAGIMAGGLSMDYRYETGLEQQVGQLAAAAMISNYYEGKLPNSIRDGLAVNLVVDVYDACDTRVDGDLRPRETQAIEIFVPGGNPDGGILPKVDANSRWRQGGGEDHFVSALRSAQKNGAEMVKKDRDNDHRKDKRRHFQLQDDSGSRRTAISGPHLGSAGEAFVRPGEDFLGDYVEFLRAYQTCFLHWLRTDAAGSDRRSAESFAQLLHDAAHMEDAAQLESVLSEKFDVEALSSEELSKREDLEGRFLEWLSKQR